MHVGPGAHARIAEAAERVGEHQAKQEHADGVIPIEKFERPLLLAGQLLGIGPGAPSQHSNDAENDRGRQTLHDEHGPDYSWWKGLVGGRTRPRATPWWRS